MLKLEHVALELFEYKVEEVRARRTVRGGLASVWELCHHLQRQAALLTPEERRRLELAERALRRISEAGTSKKPLVADFEELVLNGETEQDGDALQSREDRRASQPPPHGADVGKEQATLQGLAAIVWRHDLDRFVRRLAGGLRAERDRYTARLLYACHRNLDQYLRTDEAAGDGDLQRFQVSEAIPAHDDPFFSVNDIDTLAELVRETIDCALTLADSSARFARLGVRRGEELGVLRTLARAVAADPYAGKTGLLEQRGPTAQQLRVAIQELGKERLRDEERLSQRRQLEERLQRVLAFERNQRQMFYQDVSRFTALVDAFFDRLGRYLPRAIGGEAGSPQLPGGVLFAVNPALRIDVVAPHSTAATVRLKGPARLRLAGLEIALSGPGGAMKLYVRGEEFDLAGELAVNLERRWLYAFAEGEYLHLKVEDEARSIAVRVAEAAAVLEVLSSAQKDDLLAALRVLANSSVAEPQELVKAALVSLAGMTSMVPDRAAAISGFLGGSARAAKVDLTGETIATVTRSLLRALTVGTSELSSLLGELELGEMAVHTLTGEPLALEVASYSLTVRQYRAGGQGNQESLVVMLPGQALGTFDEYLIEPLGPGLLLCVRGEQELVVAYRRKPADAAPEAASN
jgi:hypothetical protein